MARIGRLAPLLALALALLPARAAGQDVAQRALDLEERGEWADAAALYTSMLQAEPGNVLALLGLERADAQLGRRDSTLAYARRAIAADSANATARGIELRALRTMGQDSLAAAALQRWAAVSPGSQAPYREWARLSLQTGRLHDAGDAVALARQRLHDSTALAPEMAQVYAGEADWMHAAAEWRVAVTVQPAYADPAAYNLRPAPAAAREGVERVLTAPGPASPSGRRIAADLLLGWGEPERAWAMLQGALPAADAERLDLLRGFADRARTLDGSGAQQAAGEAYEMAARLAPAADALPLLIGSARAYAAAGDRGDALRLLRVMAEDPASGDEVRAAAAATTVQLLVGEGKPEEAERLLDSSGASVGGTDRASLRRLIARGWLKRGDLDRAAAAVAADSSLAADEVRGWVAVYRGELSAGGRLLRGVGAAFGDREAAPQRAATVALLAAVGRDTLPALGAALLSAARGDSLRASRGLVAVARGLAGDAAPALLSWAARFAASGRDSAGAEALWRQIAEQYPTSSAAPAAELALARSLASRGDLKGAAARLEALILAHPESALVPEARRELDRVRGLVPG
jgi:tetratricopeptide (TPR) repeat protein